MAELRKQMSSLEFVMWQHFLDLRGHMQALCAERGWDAETAWNYLMAIEEIKRNAGSDSGS